MKYRDENFLARKKYENNQFRIRGKAYRGKEVFDVNRRIHSDAVHQAAVTLQLEYHDPVG